MGYEIRPAKRSATKPIIFLYSWSGRGKTYSALMLARGYAGPDGKVLGIDAENQRMSIYADVIPGGYDLMDIGPPFSPKNFLAALRSAEKAKPDVLVIDGLSPEWESEGGVLDMAAANEAAGKRGLLVWKDPKMEHNKLVLALLGTSIPCVIVTLRGKFKSHQKGSGKTAEVIKDTFTTPIQSDDLIYEATMHMEIIEGHAIRVTKSGHPDLRACLPADNSIPLNLDHGAAIRVWCEGGDDTRTPAIVLEARKVAKRGTEAFRDWWNMEATKKQWSILRGYIADFQREASQADEVERRRNAKYEDPFTGHVDDRTPEQRVDEHESACATVGTISEVDALVASAADWMKGLPSDLRLRVEVATAHARDRVMENAQ